MQAWTYQKPVQPDYSVYEQIGENNLDIELLKECLTQQAESHNDAQQRAVHNFIIAKLEERNIVCEYFFDAYGNMYVEKGEPGIGVIGHVDDVHDYIEDKRVMQTQDFLFAMNGKNCQQHGIGGDDKVAISIAIQILSKYPNVRAMFPKNEECGVLGTNASHLNFWDGCWFICQPDRNHYKDEFIQHTNGTQCVSQAFLDNIKPALEKYKYVPARGTITDVGALKNMGLDICCFNISAGYLKAHSDQEIVDIRRLSNTWNLLQEIIELSKDTVWKHEKPVVIPTFRGHGGYSGYGSSYYNSQRPIKCSTCNLGYIHENKCQYLYCDDYNKVKSTPKVSGYIQAEKEIDCPECGVDIMYTAGHLQKCFTCGHVEHNEKAVELNNCTEKDCNGKIEIIQGWECCTHCNFYRSNYDV